MPCESILNRVFPAEASYKAALGLKPEADPAEPFDQLFLPDGVLADERGVTNGLLACDSLNPLNLSAFGPLPHRPLILFALRVVPVMAELIVPKASMSGSRPIGDSAGCRPVKWPREVGPVTLVRHFGSPLPSDTPGRIS